MEILCRTVVLRQAQNEVYLCFSLSLETPHLRCRPGARGAGCGVRMAVLPIGFHPSPSPWGDAGPLVPRLQGVIRGPILVSRDWAWTPPRIGLPASLAGYDDGTAKPVVAIGFAPDEVSVGLPPAGAASPRNCVALANGLEAVAQRDCAREGRRAGDRDWQCGAWISGAAKVGSERRSCRDYRPGAPIENGAKG